MPFPAAGYRPKRVKLIFNPLSGAGPLSATPEQSSTQPARLVQILNDLQELDFVPEVHLVQPTQPLGPVIQDALQSGLRLFVVCGGDGTIDNVAACLADTQATLGIIPTGTQNNVALSLGIPLDLTAAVRLLRTGRRVRVDLGQAVCAGAERTFLEVCSVGLFSALFPAADDIQHGNLARIGDFLSTLVSSQPAELRLALDAQPEIRTQGHVVLVSNMPYVGPHYAVGRPGAFKDGRLDVLIFGDFTMLDLLGYAVQVVGGVPEDPRIRRLRVRSVEIDTSPAMPVMVDGSMLGEGQLGISVRPRALAVMMGYPGARI